jgi:LysM repeat protein
MTLKKIQPLILFLCLITVGQVFALPPDSVGTVQRNGKTLILHKIKSGETLLKIAKYYHTTVQKVAEQNANLVDSKIKTGQILYIPFPPINKLQTTEPTQKNLQHTVQNGETLTKIAQLYHTTIDSLVYWNQLGNATLKVGQVLQVANGGDVQGIITENMLAKIDKKKTQHEIGKGEKIVSRGEEKFVLHRHAPIGSMILIINPTNHFAVKAKVIGKIPNVDINKEILVKLSSATCGALGLVNEQFAIEVIYDKK